MHEKYLREIALTGGEGWKLKRLFVNTRDERTALKLMGMFVRPFGSMEGITASLLRDTLQEVEFARSYLLEVQKRASCNGQYPCKLEFIEYDTIKLTSYLASRSMTVRYTVAENGIETYNIVILATENPSSSAFYEIIAWVHDNPQHHDIRHAEFVTDKAAFYTPTWQDARICYAL